MAKRSLGVGLGVPAGVDLKRLDSLGAKYAVGSDGHAYCYSDARVNAKRPRPFRVAESVGSNGYKFVSIILGDTKKTIPVHVLVCLAFHGPKPTPVSVVRHLDGDKQNNTPGNLAWGSYAENEADKRRHGRTAEGERHGAVKLTDETVRIIRAAIPRGLWNAKDAAEVFGVDPSTIRNIARGRGRKAADET